MLSDNHLVKLLAACCVVLTTTNISFLALWIRSRERYLRGHFEPRTPPITDRIEHLVNAVEAMAVEVERVSEAQRFTAQALTQRPNNAIEPKRVPERVITPH